MSDLDTTTTSDVHKTSVQLTSLPDELIGMCYAGLPASDLIALELVSFRLRALIEKDGLCWRDCVKSRWGKLCANANLLPSAARHAGSWKALYVEKSASYKRYTPWFVACPAETRAMVDIILSVDTSMSERTIINNPRPLIGETKDLIGEPCSPPRSHVTATAASPVSVMENTVDCGRALNLIVLIDASSSVTEDDFKSMKLFTHALLSGLRSHFVTEESFIGLLQFNQQPRVELPLTAVSKANVSAVVDDMRQLSGSTDIAAPIRRAREMLVEATSSEDGVGPGQHGDHIIVLVTDGQTNANELFESEQESRRAKEQLGATVFTIGVGRDIDQAGLERVAAASKDGTYFTLRRFVHSR